MQIIYKVKGGLKGYIETFEETEPEKPERCVNCGGRKFYKWGKYHRYSVGEDSAELIPIRRFCCAKCGRTGSHLPDFCLSGKQYMVDFVMKLIGTLIYLGKVCEEGMERQIYRYKKRFMEKLPLFVTFLRGKGFGAFPEGRKERAQVIFGALSSLHQAGELMDSFFSGTGQHFLAG